jgi:hypothetical protein
MGAISVDWMTIIFSALGLLISGWLARHKLGPAPLSPTPGPAPQPAIPATPPVPPSDGLGDGQLLARLRALILGGSPGGGGTILPGMGGSPVLQLVLQLLAGILTHPTLPPQQKMDAVKTLLDSQQATLLHVTSNH